MEIERIDGYGSTVVHVDPAPRLPLPLQPSAHSGELAVGLTAEQKAVAMKRSRVERAIKKQRERASAKQVETLNATHFPQSARPQWSYVAPPDTRDKSLSTGSDLIGEYPVLGLTDIE